MKKLKSVLLGICILGTVCGLAGCGGEKWVFYESQDVFVSNHDSEDIISSDKAEDMRKSLEEKYKDVQLTVTENSIKGFLKDTISLERADGYDFSQGVMRAEELDSIFEIEGHTVKTYASVCVYDNADLIECNIKVRYDDKSDIYYFGVAFISPDFKKE